MSVFVAAVVFVIDVGGGREIDVVVCIGCCVCVFAAAVACG